MVRAATPIEYANEANRPTSECRTPLWLSSDLCSLLTDLASIVEQLDDMFDKEEYQKAYDYIDKNKSSPLFQSYYLQWRVARYRLDTRPILHLLSLP